MNAESRIATRTEGGGRGLPGALAALAAALVLGPAAASGAEAAKAGSGSKSSEVRFETAAGSSVKRIFLSEKAAERLGIETGRVGEQPIVRKQVVGGLVVPSTQGAPAPKPAAGGLFGGLTKVSAVTRNGPGAGPAEVPVAGDAWVLVTLSRAELARVAMDKPARLFQLTTDDKPRGELLASPARAPPVEDAKRSMVGLHYVVPGKGHGLTLNKRLRVELEMAGNGEVRKVVPYSAVYYDAKGTAWTYVSPEPRVYERVRIGVDRVAGDLAVLTDGPPLGTPVVTVGAPLLYGTEIFGK